MLPMRGLLEPEATALLRAVGGELRLVVVPTAPLPLLLLLLLLLLLGASEELHVEYLRSQG